MNDSTISSQGTLVAVRRQSEGPPAPVFGELASLLHHDDFVLLSDEGKCRLARIKNISILEASRNATLVHFAEDKLLIRRSLGECEHRLDSSIFFRASRDCIVNLSQVRQPRLPHFSPKGWKRDRLFSQARRPLPCDTRPLAAQFSSPFEASQRSPKGGDEIVALRLSFTFPSPKA